MRKMLSLIAVLVLCTAMALGQNKTMTGQVKDTKGDPIPFATIKIKGTNSAVAADANGNFTITASPNATFVISAVGFEQAEAKASSSGSLLVSLKTLEAMREVIITAQGIKRTRNQLAYAAQTINGDEVSKTRSNNFISGMSGKVAGLEIRQSNGLGGSTNVTMRGVKSFVGNNQALFVVDGVPYNNDNTNSPDQLTGRGGYDYGNAAADLNPDDIESITALKGAAATALYGSRGSNGVILITTKKRSKGLGVTVNSGISLGFIDKKTFTKYQKEYGGGYGPYYEDPTGFFFYRDINGDGVDDLVTPTSEDASFGGKFDPNLMVYQWDAFDKTSPNFGKATPWVGAANDPSTFFEKPFNNNQSIYIDGGSDKGTFKLGYTRTDDNGILPNSNIVKNLISLGATYNVANNLTAGASINFSNINGKGRYGTGYDDKNVMTNFRQWWQTNVDIKSQKDAYFRTRKNVTWNWADPTDLTPIYWDNPYFVRYENFETDRRDRIFGNVNLNYKVTDWLNIMGRIGHDSYNELQEERQAIGSIGVPSYSRFDRSYRETNFDLIANFDKDISTDLNFKALIGTNIRKQHTQSVSAITNGGLAIPGIYSLANSANLINAPVEFDGKREVDGYFAGATFSWKDMLTLDATIRRDKSSTLPKNNNVYYYPSVSLGLVFSKLLPGFDWLSYGKIRTNYAQVGNDAPIYSVLDVYNIVPPFGSEPTTTIPNTKNNPNLRPEQTRSAEVGLEMSFLKSRVGFDATYYRTRTVDQILPLAISTSTGYSNKFLNAGTIENKGIELSAFATPVQTKNFSWTLNLNWTRNRNKVIELFEGSDNLVLASFQGGVSLNASLGQAYGTIRGSNFVYTNGQRTVNDDGYYVISNTANEVIGNPNPDWIGGLNNTIKYKNLSLSFLLDMRKGGQIYTLDLSYGFDSGLYPESVGLNDQGKPKRDAVADGGGVIFAGVTEDGKANTTRVAVENGMLGSDNFPSAGFVYDASYLKLRETILTYSLPKEALGKMQIFKGVDFSLIGRNLWLIHKNLPYADPEDMISAGNFQGYQGGVFPTTRSIALNVKLRF
ncbi:SusC/RagA family TonB-linked outer membrane protein [Niastella sp. OAS944]|uniref:SusC/RagA family TonB-linked outer membrane protein n=1 Tax=Niastella sp. OAS944 TaxID=2664089 RepID=UPI00349457CF|nr:TonB-linked SusC/RagA family outer membrane protein [Chitinophagaceae bacterium OAS944]